MVAAPASHAETATQKATMNTYVNIAYATFGDSLSTAKSLKVSVDAFVSAPSEETLKAAWRVPKSVGC